MTTLPSLEKQQALRDKMEALGIRESDLEEKFILGSGKGGQKINKTASCVQMTHKPTGLVIKCQKERSREMNRFLARRELCRKLEEKLTGTSRAKQEADKIRKQKQRRRRRQKADIDGATVDQ